MRTYRSRFGYTNTPGKRRQIQGYKSWYTNKFRSSLYNAGPRFSKNSARFLAGRKATRIGKIGRGYVAKRAYKSTMEKKRALAHKLPDHLLNKILQYL